MITKEMEAVFPEKSFKLDGILAGNIVEVLAAHTYGITLYKQSEKAHDGFVGEKQIQIKGTQGHSRIVMRHEPEYLLVLFLDTATGMIREIYNGSGKEPWECSNYVSSMNHYTICVAKLIELYRHVLPQDKITAMVPIDIYRKTCIEASKEEAIKSKKKPAKTTIDDYINQFNQENRGCLNNKPGTHPNQMAYQMKCRNCGFMYESNGCDIFQRKCPCCK